MVIEFLPVAVHLVVDVPVVQLKEAQVRSVVVDVVVLSQRQVPAVGLHSWDEG